MKLIGQILDLFPTFVQLFVGFFVVTVFCLILSFVFFELFLNKLQLLFDESIKFLVLMCLFKALVFPFLAVTLFL